MIQDFQSLYKGQTAIIIGNGPSLDAIPLQQLAKKYITFGANKIYDYPFIPDHWACADALMLTECIPWVIAHPEFVSHKFVPRDVPLKGAHQFKPEVEVGFSVDVAQKVFFGGTISYINMQLARYMGFTRLLLVGMDHRYAKTEKGGKPGSKFISDGVDPDHFGKGYFSAGKLYSRPELAATEKFFYPLAKQAFPDGIINLSPDSALTVFEKGDYRKWL